MSVLNRCECKDCYYAESPCKQYYSFGRTSTTCQDERSSDEWCESCQDDLSDEFEALKLEEQNDSQDREHADKCAMGVA